MLREVGVRNPPPERCRAQGGERPEAGRAGRGAGGCVGAYMATDAHATPNSLPGTQSICRWEEHIFLKRNEA